MSETPRIGVSAIRTTKSSFVWRISEFSKLKDGFENSLNIINEAGYLKNFAVVIESPIFFTKPFDYEWSLLMFNTNRTHLGVKHGLPLGLDSDLSFKLQINEPNGKKFYSIRVNLSISILKKNGEKYTCTKKCIIHKKSEDHGRIIHTRLPCCSEFILGYVKLVDLFDETKGYLINDNLTLLCEYEITSDIKNNKIISLPKRYDVTNLGLIDRIVQMNFN